MMFAALKELYLNWLDLEAAPAIDFDLARYKTRVDGQLTVVTFETPDECREWQNKFREAVWGSDNTEAQS